MSDTSRYFLLTFACGCKRTEKTNGYAKEGEGYSPICEYHQAKQCFVPFEFDANCIQGFFYNFDSSHFKEAPWFLK